MALSNVELGEYKGNVHSCLCILCVFFCCFPKFSFVLDPSGRLGSLGRKVGSASRNLRTMRVVYCQYWVCDIIFLRVMVPANQGCPK